MSQVRFDITGSVLAPQAGAGPFQEHPWVFEMD